MDEQIVEDLLYSEEKIRDHVHLRLPETQEALRFELRQKFKINTSYCNSEIKSILEQGYEKLKIHFAAKATDLNCYFKTRKAKIPIEKGKRVDGLRIIESYI